MPQRSQSTVTAGGEFFYNLWVSNHHLALFPACSPGIRRILPRLEGETQYLALMQNKKAYNFRASGVCHQLDAGIFPSRKAMVYAFLHVATLSV